MEKNTFTFEEMRMLIELVREWNTEENWANVNTNFRKNDDSNKDLKNIVMMVLDYIEEYFDEHYDDCGQWVGWSEEDDQPEVATYDDLTMYLNNVEYVGYEHYDIQRIQYIFNGAWVYATKSKVWYVD